MSIEFKSTGNTPNQCAGLFHYIALQSDGNLTTGFPQPNNDIICQTSLSGVPYVS